MEPFSFFAAVPFNQHMGLRLLGIEDGVARVAVDAASSFVQEQGVIHGGVLTILADNAAVYLTLPQLAADERMTSIEFKMNFLEAGRTGGGELVATARVVRSGKRVVVCEAEVKQADRKLAVGLFTYLRFKPGA